ncbi:unnamed protein product, partial [marine sediment metagenome]
LVQSAAAAKVMVKMKLLYIIIIIGRCNYVAITTSCKWGF